MTICHDPTANTTLPPISTTMLIHSQTLGKCGKMLPVMVVGTLTGGKKYGVKDYMIAVSITVGCMIFLMTGVCIAILCSRR